MTIGFISDDYVEGELSPFYAQYCWADRVRADDPALKGCRKQGTEKLGLCPTHKKEILGD